jgi:acyl-coenzyme A synthetase/AMP-(fatty) acid ligase/3-hydroxymyristoyl/3-hydroxydecanoyl-(acyl carrier protein) dehydratase
LATPVPSSSCQQDFTNNIAIILQTSGSSGQSKIVQKSWWQMLREAKAILPKLPAESLAAPVVVLGSVSQQHLYGLSFRVVLSLLAGWCIDSERWVYPETLLGATAKEQKVVWISSPTLLQAFHAQHDFSVVCDRVLLVISSGGALNPTNKAWLAEKLSCPVLEIYGSTETGIVASRDRQSHWQFFAEVQCQEVVDEGLSIISPWCETPQILADAIVRHEDGFELLGRIDRIIKLAEKRVSLLQVEAHLLSHPCVQDVYIAKHPHASSLVAWIALSEEGLALWRRQGRKAMILDLKNHLRDALGATVLPRYWRFDMALPRNSQSKLSRQDFEDVVLNPLQSPIVLSEEALNAHEHVLALRVPVDLQYFKGHFDRFHLVPGVVQLKWVLEALQGIAWLHEKPPKQWENLKFQHFLQPNDTFTLRLTRDQAKGKISFQCTHGETKIASGRFVIPDVGEGL